MSDTPITPDLPSDDEMQQMIDEGTDPSDAPCTFDLPSDDEIDKIIEQSVKIFKGNMNVLESAVGALVVGRHCGWRVTRILHSGSTYRQYEKILGIKFKDVCESRGKYSYKSTGLKIADKLKAYWKIANGLKTIIGKKKAV